MRSQRQTQRPQPIREEEDSGFRYIPDRIRRDAHKGVMLAIPIVNPSELRRQGILRRLVWDRESNVLMEAWESFLTLLSS
jgi:hypothetical protein